MLEDEVAIVTHMTEHAQTVKSNG